MTARSPVSDDAYPTLPPRFFRELAWFQALVLVLATVVVYLPVIDHGFVWDDDLHFTQNPLMARPGGLRAIWFEEPFYYPLTSTTFWLARRLWGLNPLFYHELNVLLHAANAVLLWRLLRRLAVPGAWLAAALFAVHPVGVQSVAWATELKNVQSGLFFFGALLAWVRFAEGGRGRWLAACLVLALGAILSKTSTVVLPATIVAIEAWRGRHRAGLNWISERTLLAWVPLAILAMIAAALTVVLHRPLVADPRFVDPWPVRFIVAGRATWFYLGKLFMPLDLAFVYPRWQIDPGQPLAWLAPAGVLAATGALWRLRGSWGPGPLIAWVAMIAALFPVLGFFRMFYARYSYVADHWQYLAAPAVFALVAAGLSRLGAPAIARGRTPRLYLALASGVLVVLCALTWNQTLIYRDSDRLWRDTLEKNPGATLAYNNLGIDLAERGQLGRAEQLLRVGLEQAPEDPDLLTNLAAVLLSSGRAAEAEPLLRRSLALDASSAKTLNNVGLVMSALGRRAEAAAAFRRAIELAPRQVESYVNLSAMLADETGTSGALERAFGVIDEGLKANPGDLMLFQSRHILERRLAEQADAPRAPGATTAP